MNNKVVEPSDSMRIDIPGTFSEPLAITNVEIAGSIVSAERSVSFTRITA